ncbi:hypothetical protein M413DRAFT_88707 [Hebeloma cylindrosporum]|uniref:Blue (type 1) copper domain-containing protein n=1 Tax=Hebeloma cylindrosporum TaxID=76867 RepID=A0A0C3CYG0_HEBCY|nr:hypothetical protein M413DRAFT_88707 [Hebeloma cylindrosporum h7]
MLMKSAVFFLLPALTAAQYYPAPDPTSSGSSGTSSAAAAAAVPSAPADTTGHMNVNVGFGGKVFSPANITAPVGTLVTFYFAGTIPHSVTQSSFAQPCTYLVANASASTPGGFDSGLVSTGATFTINVTDTSPIWIHCKTPTHCASGMVGSINAPATGNTYDAFLTAARAFSGPSETDTGAVTGGVHGIATAPPASDTGASGSSGGTKSSATKIVGSASLVLLSALFSIVMA